MKVKVFERVSVAAEIELTMMASKIDSQAEGLNYLVGRKEV